MSKTNFYIRLGLILSLCILTALSASAQLLNNNGDTISISNNETLYINGGFNNIDNGTYYPYVYNNGVLNISGDLIKSTHTSYSGNDSVLLSGASAQNIAGLDFHYLGITGGGNKTLTNNAKILSQLNIANGILNSGIYSVILDSQAIINEDENNYLLGTAQMTKYLPIGINDFFGGMGIEINPGSITPGMTLVVRTTGSHLSGNGYQSIQRYFDITPTSNGVTGSTVIFHYFDHELNSIAESDLAVYRKRVVGKWEYNGYTLRDATLNTITASIDTLGKITAAGILHPLPVELLAFDAHLFNSETALLNWETASEINNDHFDIERSADAKQFEKIAEVAGNGTTNSIHDYQYKDPFGIITNPILYYRLKQVDYNGNYEYSEIKKLIMGTENQNTFKAWYNASSEKIEALIYYEKPTTVSIRMIDMQGKLLLEKNISFITGVSTINLETHGLAQGIYSLSVQDENGLIVKRILKY